MTRVSNIALARYLGLQQGIDIEAVRSDIEARLARAARAAEQMGGGDYSVRFNGATFIIRDGVVLTVQPKLSVGSRARSLGSPENGD